MTVYEKSKVYGGRCATRSSRESPGIRYDTGAQYYSMKTVMETIHKRWEGAGVVAPWFQDSKGILLSSTIITVFFSVYFITLFASMYCTFCLYLLHF